MIIICWAMSQDEKRGYRIDGYQTDDYGLQTDQ